MVAARGLATSVLADPGFLWEVPDKWTLEEAATIPVVYATVSSVFKSLCQIYYFICNNGLNFCFRVTML